ncbi:hypothetical protein BGW42_008299 [Actinomortierella wolfii]|nr:hypothetical protein BGW42_008299 [Actinomortierella wolfii]
MPGGLYGIVCVHRGNLLECIRQYESDEEELDATRRLLWPDRGDGKSFVSREDYPDSSDAEDSITQFRHEQLRLAREAHRAMYSARRDRNSRDRARQQTERNVIYFDDEYESEGEYVDSRVETHLYEATYTDDEGGGNHEERVDVRSSKAMLRKPTPVEGEDDFEEEHVDARGEAFLCKPIPEDSGIDLGYDAEDEENECDGTATPKRRSPKQENEPPEVSRGYVAESTVGLCHLPTEVDPQYSKSSGKTPCTPSRETLLSHLAAEYEDGSNEDCSEEGDSKDDKAEDDSADDNEKENVNPNTLRWPLSDNTLFASRRHHIVPRGAQSCSLVEDPSNPFLSAPRKADLLQRSSKSEIPVLDERNHIPQSPSIRRASIDQSSIETSGKQEGRVNADETTTKLQDKNDDSICNQEQPTNMQPIQPQEFVADFGASILAARPLGVLPTALPPRKHALTDETEAEEVHFKRHMHASPEPHQEDFELSRIEVRPLDPVDNGGISDQEEQHADVQRIQSREFVADFGASILAALPLGLLPNALPPRKLALPDTTEGEELHVKKHMRASLEPHQVDLECSRIEVRPLGPVDDGGVSDQEEQPANVQRIQPREYVSDFGASILAARPLGSLQSIQTCTANPRKHVREDPTEEEDVRERLACPLSPFTQPSTWNPVHYSRIEEEREDHDDDKENSQPPSGLFMFGSSSVPFEFNFNASSPS